MDSCSDDSLKTCIRKARAKFLAMTATYCAGIKPTNCFGIEAVLTAVVVSWLFFTLPKGDSDA